MSEYFFRDLERHNKAFRDAGAVIEADGTLAIDPNLVPSALLSSYRMLLSYGYANGLI